tara:strand:+ start:1642 stop:3006 length:1365 start_codon:yes stop_codon:yes gene_type:complete
MIGAQTIGNATVVAYDKKPILTTDPWLGLDHYAYFGSWYLPYDIPQNINQDILSSEYIFFSHGHPDHLNPDSVHKFKNNKIILGDHVGKRMFNDLKSQGFNVTILKERVWTELSKNISVMSVSTKIQDTILLIKIKDDVFINLNDAGPMSHRFIKKVVKRFKRKFLLSISGWGDADMINFYDKENKFIEPLAAKKHPVGDYLSLIAKLFSANYVIPFSSFHEYQREDSVWANIYVTPMEEYKNGIHKNITFIEPFAFINSEKDGDIVSLPLKKKKLIIKKAEEFNDKWSDVLEAEDKKIINKYFNKFEELQSKIGFINFIVGKKDFNIKMKGPAEKGISFELPRNSLVEACKYSIFDDLLIGNFMKTQLHNLETLYDPIVNFNNLVPKYGDNGLAYTKAELINYEKEYAKRMGIEYFYDLFANQSKNYFKFFFKNYKNSKYYTKFRRYYYYLLR